MTVIDLIISNLNLFHVFVSDRNLKKQKKHGKFCWGRMWKVKRFFLVQLWVLEP